MPLKLPVSEKDHIQGNADARIELVEYGDYQCPYCGAAYPEVKKVQKEMGDKMKLVFRNFPLTNMHENALNAAIAAEVAGNMGKFWEMHDMLYQNQRHLGYDYLVQYAEKIGLDTQQFEEKFQQPQYKEKIEQDLESGLRSGVNGTPSFFINGKKYEGSYNAEEMIEYLRSL